jgi:hyperosmotically inducible protein
MRAAIPALAAALLGLGGCATDTATPTRDTAIYVDDAVISTKIKSAFATDSQVSFNDVEVETYNGVVQLSGFVDSQAEADRAVSLARNVAGVREVKNDMRLKSAALNTK